MRMLVPSSAIHQPEELDRNPTWTEPDSGHQCFDSPLFAFIADQDTAIRCDVHDFVTAWSDDHGAHTSGRRDPVDPVT